MTRILTLSAIALLAASFSLQAKLIELHLQTRDKITGRPITHAVSVDTQKTGIVIVDPWDYHWCITWSNLYASNVPRWNQTLAYGRSLGMQVLWAPTDVASRYVGTPQREKALAVPYLPVPDLRHIACTFAPAWTPCACGPGIACRVDYGFGAINPNLHIAADDLIVAGTEELYSVCKKKGLVTLIYMGGATNICLTGKPEGAVRMSNAGLQTMFARDLTEGWSGYDPDRGLTSEKGNEIKAAEAERCGIASIEFVQELRHAGIWEESKVVDVVRMSPWGVKERPYYFEKSTTLTLATPYLQNARIVYTLNGSEPTPNSPRYDKPLLIKGTTTVRAAAFSGTRRLSLESKGVFIQLPTAPPAPDVFLDNLEPVKEPYMLVPGDLGAALAECFWHPHLSRSYEDKPLRVRGEVFRNGIGMLAPANIRYMIHPGYRRFVALAGIDDNMLDKNLGRFLASRPSVIFRVFIDGELAGESPIIRMSHEPWRFNIALPPNARQLDLSVSPSTKEGEYDFANWLNAGFMTERHTPHE